MPACCAWCVMCYLLLMLVLAGMSSVAASLRGRPGTLSSYAVASPCDVPVADVCHTVRLWCDMCMCCRHEQCGCVT
jgi:hypothetical protein